MGGRVGGWGHRLVIFLSSIVVHSGSPKTHPGALGSKVCTSWMYQSQSKGLPWLQHLGGWSNLAGSPNVKPKNAKEKDQFHNYPVKTRFI